MNDRISVTVALSVTVDPKSWYARFHADPGIDIPDRMLSHLRLLPGVQEAGGKVELHRLIRRGSRHCRQSAQHRCVGGTSLRAVALPRPNLIDVGYLLRLCRRLSAATITMQRMCRVALTLDQKIPSEPSANFL